MEIRQSNNRTTTIWAMLGGIAALDIFWGWHAGLTVHGAAAPVAAAVALVGTAAVCRRLGHWGRCIGDIAELNALVGVFTMTSAVLTYLAASTAAPLQDARLAAADHALGFDWATWTTFINARPALRRVCEITYGSLAFQSTFAVIFLPMIGRTERAIELLVLSTLTLLATAVISAVEPSLGPSPGGYSYLPDLLAIRSPGPWDFDLPAMQGIVTMPSYHTILAVLLTYALRDTGPVGWIAVALNAAMLPAIPPMGDHYLADIIAGVALVLAAIAILRAIDGPGRRHVTGLAVPRQR